MWHFKGDYWLKQKMDEIPSLETKSLSHIWTLETNTFRAYEFLQICKLIEQIIRNTLSFGSVVQFDSNYL
jgi:hypothetical protein